MVTSTVFNRVLWWSGYMGLLYCTASLKVGGKDFSATSVYPAGFAMEVLGV